MSLLNQKRIKNLLKIVRFLLGNSPASEFYIPTFQNTVCSIFITTRLWRWNRQSVPTCIKSRCLKFFSNSMLSSSIQSTDVLSQTANQSMKKEEERDIGKCTLTLFCYMVSDHCVIIFIFMVSFRFVNIYHKYNNNKKKTLLCW